MQPDATRRVARSGVLVLGGGFAGHHAARALGARGLTIVEPRPTQARLCPNADLIVGAAVALDAALRVVHVKAKNRGIAVAYAQLIVALGTFADSVAGLGLPRDPRGRVPVDENFRVIGALNVWALGDCAALPPGATHKSISALSIPA